MVEAQLFWPRGFNELANRYRLGMVEAQHDPLVYVNAVFWRYRLGMVEAQLQFSPPLLIYTLCYRLGMVEAQPVFFLFRHFKISFVTAWAWLRRN